MISLQEGSYMKNGDDINKLNMGDIEDVLKQVDYNKHQEILEEKSKLEQDSNRKEKENIDLKKRLIRSKAKNISGCGESGNS